LAAELEIADHLKNSPRLIDALARCSDRKFQEDSLKENFGSIHVRRYNMAKVNVRYIVDDVDAAIPFYRDMLGFKVDMHPAPGFASLSRGDLQLLLNRPGAGGAGQSMRDGQSPQPGGWNRIQVEVDDIEATVSSLKSSGARFRNDIVSGNGGKQILIEDPSGNPIELFQPF
jgi:catechol 2,3-dioxygenase-like lactoylglutathione lyase family enzyme